MSISKIIIRPKHLNKIHEVFGCEGENSEKFKKWIHSITGWNVVWIFHSFEGNEPSITITKGPIC